MFMAVSYVLVVLQVFEQVKQQTSLYFLIMSGDLFFTGPLDWEPPSPVVIVVDYEFIVGLVVTDLRI